MAMLSPGATSMSSGLSASRAAFAPKELWRNRPRPPGRPPNRPQGALRNRSPAPLKDAVWPTGPIIRRAEAAAVFGRAARIFHQRVGLDQQGYSVSIASTGRFDVFVMWTWTPSLPSFAARPPKPPPSVSR